MSKILGPEFDDWVAQWEKAQSDGTFENAPKPPVQNNNSFFGMNYSTEDSDLPPGDADTQYWNQVYQRSDHSGQAPDIAAPEEMLTETKKKPVEKKPEPPKKKVKPLPERRPLNEEAVDPNIKKIVKGNQNSPNPIYYYSAGKDQEPHVTPNFTDGPKMRELIDLKLKVHALEGKVNTMIGEGKPDTQVDKVERELRKIREKLDELSDTLNGGWAGSIED
jgi:hypothetical protein